MAEMSLPSSSRSGKAAKRKANKKHKLAGLLLLTESNNTSKAEVDTDNVIGDDEECDESKEKRSRNVSELEYEELKARLRERKKMLKTMPNFDVKTSGHDASIESPLSLRTPLLMADIQHLLMYTLVGDRVPYGVLRWCKMDKWTRLSHVVVLVIDNLCSDDFERRRESEKSAKLIDKLIKWKLEVVSPHTYQSSVIRDLSVLPLTNRRKDQLRRQHFTMTRALEKEKNYHFFRSVFPVRPMNKLTNPNNERMKLTGGTEDVDKAKKIEGREDDEPLKLRLLLSAEEMLQDGYPLPLRGSLASRYSDYVLSCKSYEEVSSSSPLFSVDCEMCRTTTGRNELTEICVVDENLEVVYYSLVKPENPVTNYLTKFSGLTEERLEGVTTTLQQVQIAISKLLPPNAILVGQSLNSDLHALKMMHPYVIDTSVIFNLSGERGRKPKLAALSAIFLNEHIQCNEESMGHNPEEDAKAAMKLVQLKLSKGASFGDVRLSKSIPALQQMGGDESSSASSMGVAMFNEIEDQSKSIEFITEDGPSLRKQYDEIEYLNHFVSWKASRKEVIEAMCEGMTSKDLIVGHFNLSAGDSQLSWKKVAKAVNKVNKEMRTHGMLIVLLSGSPQGSGLCGITLKKINN